MGPPFHTPELVGRTYPFALLFVVIEGYTGRGGGFANSAIFALDPGPKPGDTGEGGTLPLKLMLVDLLQLDKSGSLLAPLF